jgi:hypothetical protein
MQGLASARDPASFGRDYYPDLVLGGAGPDITAPPPDPFPDWDKVAVAAIRQNNALYNAVSLLNSSFTR